jgi:hypothetical protein
LKFTKVAISSKLSLLPENGEKPFGVLTRKVIKAEMKARTPSQAGNLLSALRGMIRWMIDEGHLDEDDDPTIGLKSGKAKASRESGGFLPWTEDDMIATEKSRGNTTVTVPCIRNLRRACGQRAPRGSSALRFSPARS